MKFCWNLEYYMRKTTTARRSDLTLEGNNNKQACSADKHQEKLQKYQQLAFETREKQWGFKVQIVPVVNGSLPVSGGMRYGKGTKYYST